MKITTLAFASLVMLSSSASYAGLTGNEVQANWTYTTYLDQNKVVVGQGVELDGLWGGGHNLDIGDDYIEVFIPIASGLSAGVSWSFFSPEFSDFYGASVTTNFSGFNDSWFNLTPDSFIVTFAEEVSFPFGNAQIRFDLLPVQSTVPEPSSMILSGLGLASMLFAMRRRSR